MSKREFGIWYGKEEEDDGGVRNGRCFERFLRRGRGKD